MPLLPEGVALVIDKKRSPHEGGQEGGKSMGLFDWLKSLKKLDGVGDFSVDYHEESPLYDFVSDSVRAVEASGDVEKLRQLEKLLPGLTSFVKSSFESDGELPPYVPCRDTLPELYMRFGEWEKAEGVVGLCVSCGAYGHIEYRNNRGHKGHWVPESGEDVLSAGRLCHAAADAALLYLSENPGTIQSKIYKIPALSGVDHDSLVWFCRYSHQVRKEKDGKSNRLYIAEETE